MKKLVLSLTATVLVALTVWAQAPQQMNYQAVVRGTNGNPVANSTPVKLRFTIHDGSAGGPSVFTETINATANQFGLVNVQIGSVANLGTVNWGTGTKFLQVETDVNNAGSFTDMGTSQLLSVPYALYAASSPAGATGPAGPQGPAGAAGAAGANGTDGAIGATGAQGPQGATGPAGANGADGAQGPQGATGAVGPQGATGAAGAQGATGAQGPTGIGVAGPTGPGASINGTTNSVPKFTNATTLGNSQITDDGTTVSVGTPFLGTGLLQVAGGVSTNSTNGAGFYGFQNGTFVGGSELFLGAWDIYSGGTNNITLTPGGGSTAMTLLSTNGNVGIGTATPGAKLEVNGQVKITGGAPGAGKVLTSDATGLASWQTPTGGVGATGPTGPAGAVGAQGPTGAAGTNGAQGPQGATGAAGAQGPTGIGVAGPAGATGATGAPGPTGTGGGQWTTNGVNIHNSNTGNVGIGLTAPTSKLDVVGRTKITYTNLVGDSSDYFLIVKSTALANSWSGISFDNDAGSKSGIMFLSGVAAPSFNFYNSNGLSPVACNALGFNVVSDITKKTDVTYLTNTDYNGYLKDIRNVESIVYRYKNGDNGKLHLGFVAQSLPESVRDEMPSPNRNATAPIGVSVNLADMTGLLLTGVKALDNKQSELELLVNQQQQIIQSLQQQLNELKSKK